MSARAAGVMATLLEDGVAAPDHVTILHTLGGALLAKRITEVGIEAYDRATWFSVEQMPVFGIIELGKLLARLERDPHACAVRGRPVPGSNRERCRRLLYAQIENDVEVPATFEPAARRWLALDIDGLPTPVWAPDALALRREAIAHDHAAYPDAVRLSLGGDLDPAPIDPVRDHALIARYVVGHLPAEFADAHAWWQLTSSAGIKPGIRLRLWYWLDRPVSDDEARRWLVDVQVDLALYNPIQPHYTAAPQFSPPSLDPVPVRSGMWWRHVDTVPVPALPEPEPPPRVEFRPVVAVRHDAPGRRAQRYADSVIQNIGRAPPTTRHLTMRSAAITLYSMAEHEFLDPADITRSLLDSAASMSWPTRRIYDLLDWCRAAAAANPTLPKDSSNGRPSRPIPHRHRCSS